MGFWDVLLFNIATVLGPRWIAAAGHNGTSSISLWALAALFFFVPGAFVINELSSRFPEEGGLYAWSREAFGPFHGFVAGWTYWFYTVFYFPGLLLASASMAAYIFGPRGAALAQDRTFLLSVSFAMLIVAVVLNIIGLNVGKWLQNAGGGHLRPTAHARRHRRPRRAPPRLSHPLHHRQHAPHLELGHRQLLVADRLRLHRP
jgi:amino acid transporter